jgi:hypothetical protein
MRHLIVAAFMIIAALGVTSFAASALQSWAMARNVSIEVPPHDVARHDARGRESLDLPTSRQGRARAASIAGI